MQAGARGGRRNGRRRMTLHRHGYRLACMMADPKGYSRKCRWTVAVAVALPVSEWSTDLPGKPPY